MVFPSVRASSDSRWRAAKSGTFDAVAARADRRREELIRAANHFSERSVLAYLDGFAEDAASAPEALAALRHGCEPIIVRIVESG
jgi:hypothetical protein